MPHREKRSEPSEQLPRELELADRDKLEGNAEIRPEELRTLIELSTDLIAITGYDGHFQVLNKAWETTLGYSRDELRSKPFLEFVHPEDREKTSTMVQRLLPGVPLFSFQNRYLCKDGTYRPIHWRGFTSVDAQRYYTVAREVSQIQAADAQRNAFDVVCEQSRDAIVITTASGVITEWTGAAEKLFGYSRKEIVGERIVRYVMDDSGNHVRLLSLPPPVGDADRVSASFLHRDGRQCRVLIAVTAVGNAETPIAGCIATISLA